MALIAQQYRIFAYDPTDGDGAYRAVADTWGESELAAIAQFKADNQIAGDADGRNIQLVARAHSDRDRWPNPATGRLPRGGL